MVQAVNLPNILAYPTFKSDKLPPIYQENLESQKRIEYKNLIDDKICNKENGEIDMSHVASTCSVCLSGSKILLDLSL